MKIAIIALSMFTLFVVGCGSSSTNNPPGSVGVLSSPTPSPTASASPSPSGSPTQAVFRSLEQFIDCGPVTPGTCTPRDMVVNADGTYEETESGHTGQLTSTDFQNLVQQVNNFWNQFGTGQLMCVDPPQPLVGGHAETLSMIVSNPTVLLFDHEPEGRECGLGDLNQARSLHNAIKNILSHYQ